ncbi:hypothetical protein NSPZN2_100103 [Nitrospira defluvii]|uniref:Uncharacterized protein n=1 Tax=Nitrospira defluvii TaxID=330214 RepID=A0ABN7L5A4_9BACT|nr:hypothetical protein NSPZN2_100103 [Nitrospira defluvii]
MPIQRSEKAFDRFGLKELVTLGGKGGERGGKFAMQRLHTGYSISPHCRRQKAGRHEQGRGKEHPQDAAVHNYQATGADRR